MYKKFTNLLCSVFGYLTKLLSIENALLSRINNAVLKKWIMRIQITTLIIIMSLVQVSATTLAQNLTFKQSNVTFEKVFMEIRKQTGHDVFFEVNKLKISSTINANFNHTPLDQVMLELLKGTKLTFSIVDQTIVIKEVEKSIIENILSVFNNIEVKGIVVDEKSQWKEGVTVKIKSTGKTVYTDKYGKFELQGVKENEIIIFSHIGYNVEEIKADEMPKVVSLKLADSRLDEVQVMAYGVTSRRKSTGNITKVTGEDIRLSPVSNPLIALQGLVPGMIVTETNGLPGSAVKLQIRGRTKIDRTHGADDSPLFIIDGVPMASGNSNLSQIASAISSNLSSSDPGGISPFSLINSGDIESLEVLKDADATAIYGSRGANGVVLITTKKGIPGNTKFNIKLSSGFSKAPLPEMLNTEEYLMMRNEAFKNDNISKTNSNAYDLLLWDTSVNNNSIKNILGRSAYYSDAQANLSGGTELISYNLGGSYSRQTVPFPSSFPNTRGNINIAVSTKSADRKFSADFRGTYGFSHNRAPMVTPTAVLKLAPFFKLYNEDGSLAWNQGGIQIDNPLATLKHSYSAKNASLTGNALLQYRFNSDLTVKANVGYNQVKVNEISSIPSTAINPLANLKPSSTFANADPTSWIMEPQLEYRKNIHKGRLTLLAGGTIQFESNFQNRFTINGYTSDEYLGTLIGLRNDALTAGSSKSNEYKYQAVFARANYDFDDKYILNLTARRDGSSRFGPGYRYSNFGAVGASWIFSNETFLENNIISFGKLRASYGLTGNDKIGDYKFLGLYEAGVFSPTYNGELSISPFSLFKNDLHWELNKKLEFGMEVGFFKDRMLFVASLYRNRSSDPLVSMPLPGTTGFGNVIANLEGIIVQNQGLELSVDFKNLDLKDFSWRTSFNITFPDNKLVVFPGLKESVYNGFYEIGKSLNLVNLMVSLGVDPMTGNERYEDINGDGNISSLNFPRGDLSANFDFDPAFYGGLQNHWRYKRINLSVLMNFNKQWTKNWRGLIGGPLGAIQSGNVPKEVLQRWQKEGDNTDVRRFTTLNSPAVYDSDLNYENLFFVRLGTVQLSYNLPTQFVKKIGLKDMSVFCSGQNLVTFAPFGGFDPQTVVSSGLAPLRTYVAGINFNF